MVIWRPLHGQVLKGTEGQPDTVAVNLLAWLVPNRAVKFHRHMCTLRYIQWAGPIVNVSVTETLFSPYQKVKICVACLTRGRVPLNLTVFWSCILEGR
jgi:hypothetical protein